MSDCCEELLSQVRALRGETEGLAGILPRIARLEAQVQEMANGGDVDLSPVLNQLSQLRSQVSGISGEIQSSESRIIAALRTALSGLEALFRTILAEVLGAIRVMAAESQASLRAISSDLLAALRVVAGEVRNAVNEVIAPVAQAIASLIRAIASSQNRDDDAISAINVAKTEIISHVKLESAEVKSLVRQLGQEVSAAVGALSSFIQRTTNSLADLVRLLGQIQGVNSSIAELKGLVQSVFTKVSSLEGSISEVLSRLRGVDSQLQQILGALRLEAINGMLARLLALLNNQGNDDDAISAINVAKTEIISHVKLEGAGIKSLVRQGQQQVINALEYLSFILQRLSGTVAELLGLSGQIRAISSNIAELKNAVQTVLTKMGGLEGLISEILSRLRGISPQLQEILNALRSQALAAMIARLLALLNGQGNGTDPISAINAAKTEIISHIKLESADIKALIRQVQQQIINLFSALTNVVGSLSQQVRDFSTKVDGSFTGLKEFLKGLTLQVTNAVKAASDKSEAQTKDQTKQILEALKKALEPILKNIEKIGYRIAKIYAVLGGTFWGNIDDRRLPEGRINPEYLIQNARGRMYENGDTCGEITVLNLINIITNLSTVGYQRSGFHRFPATLPKNITDGSDETVKIYDAASWQEWLFMQLDSISGNYPIKIKYKNSAGNEKDIQFSNQAEAIAELIGLTMSLDTDTDVLQELAFKTIAETIKAEAAAITAADYSKANSKYLGYKNTEKEREISLSVSPGAKSIKTALTPSIKKMPIFEFAGSEDLQDTLQALVTAGDMVKASVFRPWDIIGGELPGDRIKAQQETESDKNDEEWAEFLANIKEPPANQLDPNAPRADIRNLAQNEEPI